MEFRSAICKARPYFLYYLSSCDFVPCVSEYLVYFAVSYIFKHLDTILSQDCRLRLLEFKVTQKVIKKYGVQTFPELRSTVWSRIGG